MASYDVETVKHATLKAGEVDEVHLGRDFNDVEVLNRGGGEIYFTTNGRPPTVHGDDIYVVASGAALKVQSQLDTNTVVKLISETAVAYSVTGI